MNYIIFDLEWNQPYSNDISFMKRTGMPITGRLSKLEQSSSMKIWK